MFFLNFILLHYKKLIALLLTVIFIFVLDYGHSLSVFDFQSKEMQFSQQQSDLKPFNIATATQKNYFIDNQQQPSVHAASAVETDDNDLLAVWFAGSREGHKDVTIEAARFSLKNKTGWQPQKTLLDREILADQLGIYIKKLGNPMLVKRSENELWLFFVSVSIGGWATSQVNYMISKDNGHSWGKAKQLKLSPLVNISYLIRNKALVDIEGRIWLPIYFELGNHIPEYLVMNGQAEIVGRGRFDQLKGSMQPVFVEPIENRGNGFDVYARPAEPTNIPMLLSSNIDSTLHQQDLMIENPNSGIEVVASKGSLMMANNPIEAKRGELWLYEKKKDTVTDDKNNWSKTMALELGDPSREKNEFSYPWMMFDSFGDLHVFYTYQRERIKHVVFSDSHDLEELPQ